MIDTSRGNAMRLAEMSRRMRLDAIDMAWATGTSGAHIGGGLSCIEILAVLYGEVLKFDLKNPVDINRDRFLASKTHCVLAHIPALAEAGFISHEEILDFQKPDGRLTGYPYSPEVGFEYTGGSLGMALSVGIGLAISAKENQRNFRVYVLMGDGELDEGSNWEAFMSASHYKLDNLIAIIDRNHLSYDGNTEDIMRLEPLPEKMKAFHWHVSVCDGHDTEALLKAFADTAEGSPHIIIADTVKGKGVSFAENRPEWHHHSLTREQYESARAEVLKAECCERKENIQ